MSLILLWKPLLKEIVVLHPFRNSSDLIHFPKDIRL